MANEAQGATALSSNADRTAETPGDKNSGDTGAMLATSEGGESLAIPGMQTGSVDSLLAGLPLQLDVTIPIPSFRVGDLLALEKGAVLGSGWAHTEDVPVWCGGAQLAWTEFEVVEDKLAVRITRIS